MGEGRGEEAAGRRAEAVAQLRELADRASAGSDFRASRTGADKADDRASEHTAEHTRQQSSAEKSARAAWVKARDKIAPALHDFLLKVTPMGDIHASNVARAVAKDFANAIRWAKHQGAVADAALRKGFTHDQLMRMWRAADEHSVALQEGKSTDGIGLNRLNAKERQFVERMQRESDEALQEAIEAGIFDGDDMLPSYVPRMVIRMTASGASRFGKSERGGANGEGRNLRVSTAQMKARKHLRTEDTNAAAQAHDSDAQVLENIRTLPLATAKLREAVAGRKLVECWRGVGTLAGAGDEMGSVGCDWLDGRGVGGHGLARGPHSNDAAAERARRDRLAMRA